MGRNRTNERLLRWSLALGGLVFHAQPGVADLVYFKNGGAAQVPVVRRGRTVVLETPVGRFAFDNDDFRAIVPGYDPPREWERIKAEALLGGLEDRLGAAWWAVENGCVRGAVEVIRASRNSSGPDDRVRRLNALLDAYERPVPASDTTPLKQALRLRLTEEASPHVTLLHEHGSAWARDRVALLEDVILAFHLRYAWKGVELRLPTRRLVFAAVARPSDYAAFLAREHAGAFRATEGYFHPAREAVILLAPVEEGDETHPPPRSEAPRPDPAGRDEDRRRLLARLDRRARSSGTAAHEAVHLLVATSGLRRRPGAFPVWLEEGLATQYEVVRGGRWAGVSRANDARFREWEQAAAAPDLAGLLRDFRPARGYDARTYARCWSLVYFLEHEHPDALLDLMAELNRKESQRESSAETAAIGRLETALGGSSVPWVEYLRRSLPPLRANEPRAMAAAGFDGGCD